MKLVYPVSGLLLLALRASAGDVHGHALITKRLSKKALSPIIYNLRGTATPVAPPEAEPVNEFDRMVVILEAGKNGGSRRQSRRSPKYSTSRERVLSRTCIVVPVGSTVEFPNSDPIFHNVFSLSKAQPFDLGYYPQGQSRTREVQQSGCGSGVLPHPRQYVCRHRGDRQSLVSKACAGRQLLVFRTCRPGATG